MDTLKKASEPDWSRLEQAAVAALVQGEKDVLIAFSYVFKYPTDFPKGVLHHQEGPCDVRRVKAVKLLHWLNTHGYSTITPLDVRNQVRDFGKVTGSVDRMSDIVDNGGLDIYDWDEIERIEPNQ